MALTCDECGAGTVPLTKNLRKMYSENRFSMRPPGGHSILARNFSFRPPVSTAGKGTQDCELFPRMAAGDGR